MGNSQLVPDDLAWNWLVIEPHLLIIHQAREERHLLSIRGITLGRDLLHAAAYLVDLAHPIDRPTAKHAAL
jgi:hypothetical protein